MLNETYRAMLGHKSVIRETFMYGKQRAAEIGYENVFDYSLGNPSVPCPDKFTKVMQTLLVRAKALKFQAKHKAFALTGRLADCHHTQGDALG